MRALGLASLSPTARAWALDILAGLLLVLVLMALWVAGACEASTCPQGYRQEINPTTGLSYCVPTWVFCPVGYYPAGSDAHWFCAVTPTGGPPAGPPVIAAVQNVPTLSEWALVVLGLMLSLIGARRLR